jgi:N-acetyl-gamma-glutamyl-phosphate reductase
MGTIVSVAGASGYAGGELLRLLAAHPDLDLGAVTAGASAGSAVGDLHPHLVGLSDRVFEATDVASLGAADVAFLALPHGESTALAGPLRERGVRVVDLGADHRLRDPHEWRQWYGSDHPAPERLDGSWPYGLPELPGAREALGGAHQVAVPGCYATAVALALHPLLAAGVVEPDDVVVSAASGTTGAGRAAKAALLASEVMGDLTAYKVGAHQHTPEIEQTLGGAGAGPVTLSLTTVLAPMPRGILATCTARLRPGVDSDDLVAALQGAYAGERFVHVLPPGRWPHTAATVGSNACHLQVVADVRAGRAVVVAAIDNLGKGAAGQAVQCANLMLGLDEGAGLTATGVAP